MQASWQDAGGKMQDEWQAELIQIRLWCDFTLVITAGFSCAI